MRSRMPILENAVLDWQDRQDAIEARGRGIRYTHGREVLNDNRSRPRELRRAGCKDDVPFRQRLRLDYY